MTEMPISQWYVVQTHPRAEARAVSHLLRQGYQPYLPRFLKRRRHARRIDLVPAPFFPNYLFVALDLASQVWHPIQSTVGVARIIRNGDAPAQIDGRIVESLKMREDESGFIQFQQQPAFRRGDKLRVIEGVFGDALAIFESMTDSQRVTVLLDLLGRKVRVVLDSVSVAAA